MRDVARLPKAHLHVHLESTIRWATLRELAATHGVTVPDAPEVFADFREFGDYNRIVRDCLRAPEDFRRVAREFCADEAAQGTGYAEVTVSAVSHGQRLGHLEMPLEAVLTGLAEGQAEHGIECRVLLDHSRRRSVWRAWRTFDLALRYRDAGVIGLGLAGEESYPLAPFAEVCAAAEEAGLRLVHHAGESRGAASIREAVVVGRAERLGHGIRVVDEDVLVQEIRTRGIPLEVCPSSNVALSFTDSLSAHPFPLLRTAGLRVTINTDIPALLGISLTDEYIRIRDAFGYDDQMLAEFARAGVDASFAGTDTRRRLRERITGWLGG